MRQRGLFIAIEGSDGCGKNTQAELIKDKLEAENKEILKLDFPQYKSDSSYFVRKYLAGEYGDLKDISEKEASLFFALDRYDAKTKINRALNDGQTVITDRFVASNLAHQGSKINDSTKRLEFFKWIDDLEFNILKIPQPDLNIILDIPTETSQTLIETRLDPTKVKKDIHEQDLNHQAISRQIYRDLCLIFPEKFKYINCLNDNNELNQPQLIAEKIWQEIEKLIVNNP